MGHTNGQYTDLHCTEYIVRSRMIVDRQHTEYRCTDYQYKEHWYINGLYADLIMSSKLVDIVDYVLLCCAIKNIATTSD